MEKILSKATATQETKISGINLARMILWGVRYWCAERVIGVGLLFYAVITAFTPFVSNTSMQYISDQTGLNIIIVSHWFLLSALYLLLKGKDTSFAALLLCSFPLTLQIFSDFIYSIELQNGGYIAREILVGGFVFRHIVIRLTTEILRSAGISNTQLE